MLATRDFDVLMRIANGARFYTGLGPIGRLVRLGFVTFHRVLDRGRRRDLAALTPAGRDAVLEATG